jgi:hypothetical protein
VCEQGNTIMKSIHMKSIHIAGVLTVSASMLALTAAFPVSAQQQLPPNLEPLPAYDLVLRPTFPSGTELAFSTLTWNSGLGPLEVFGGEVAGEELQNIYQRIYRDDGMFDEVLAGTFVFHDEHGHIHVEDYSEYILEKEDAPGQSTRLGHKTSFCLLDTDRIDRRLPGAPKRPVYNSCGELKQGISVGWGDAYTNNLPGQSIDVTGLESGYYLLTIVTDPENRLIETDETDNSSTIRIYLDMEALTVDGAPGGGDPPDPPGDVTIESMTPATMFAGEEINVTITGTGFTEGMSVRLVNGSGPAPSIRATFQDENTFTATIRAKTGGPPRTRVWDLEVGPVTLEGALTVFP